MLSQLIKQFILWYIFKKYPGGIQSVFDAYAKKHGIAAVGMPTEWLEFQYKFIDLNKVDSESSSSAITK